MKAEDILNNTDPEELRNIIHRLRQQLAGSLRPPPNTIVNANPGLFPMTEFREARAVDNQGRLRMIMSALDLFEQHGIHAHFAGFSTSGNPQIWLSADDGSLKAGGGDVSIDGDGIWIENQQGAFGFEDTSGNRFNIYLSSNAQDSLNIINQVGGKKIQLRIDSATHAVLDFLFGEHPSFAEVARFYIQPPSGQALFNLADGTYIWTGKDGTETVFNENSYDIDLRIEGATDANLFKLDAGLDAIGIGGAAESGYKLKVTGNLKVTGDLEIENGSAVLGSSFGITGTAGTYQDTGLSVTLPSAGTFQVDADIRAALVGNAGILWWIHAKLYNSTDSADVANSETLVVLTGTTNLHLQNTAHISMTVTVAASKTIKLYAARNGSDSPSWTGSSIASDSNGRTRMRYAKIG